MSARDTKFSRKVSSGTPQKISQVEENETQEGQRNAGQNSNDTTQMCHKKFEILLSYKVDQLFKHLGHSYN